MTTFGAMASTQEVDHTMMPNRTKKIWISAQDLVADGPTLTTTGTAPEQIRQFPLTATGTNGAFGQIPVPADAVAASPLSIEIIYKASSSSTATVVWSVNALAAPTDGSVDIIGAGTTTGINGGDLARTADRVYLETAQILASVSAGSIIRVNVRRLGDDAADTYGGTARLLGIRLLYTADM